MVVGLGRPILFIALTGVGGVGVALGTFGAGGGRGGFCFVGVFLWVDWYSADGWGLC